MEDQNIIIFLDKIKKLIELGNTPKAADEIDTLIIELEHHIRKKQGMVIVPLVIPNVDEISHQYSSHLTIARKQTRLYNLSTRGFQDEQKNYYKPFHD